VHEFGAALTVNSAIVALHDPVEVLVSAGHQLGARPRERILPCSLAAPYSASDVERCDQHCGPDDPPNEFDDQSDDEQDD
jgi:hypothetical protein